MTQQHGSGPVLTDRLPTTHTALAVLAGDLVALFAFVAVGQYSHGYLFWEFPARTVVVTAPIVGSWLLVAPVAGLYRDRTVTSYRHTALALVPAWVCASLLGGAVRRTALVPGNAPVSFLLVNVVFGLLFLGLWRAVATGCLR